MQPVKLDLHPNHTLHVACFTGVRNAGVIREAVMSRKVDVAAINAAMVLNSRVSWKLTVWQVCSLFQLQIAATKALSHQDECKLITHTVHSELVFCMSPHSKVVPCDPFLTNPQISVSLKVFGVDPACDSVVLAMIDAPLDAQRAVLDLVDGFQCDMGTLGTQCDREGIIRAYGISETELEGGLEGAVVTRIAVRDV